jgi:ferredoxin-NADP reductase
MTPPWDDDTLECVALRPDTQDITTFTFAPLQPSHFHFQPGQFMTFDLAGIQRCYTIASPPTRPARLEITVKRSGPGSTWLHTALKPGMRVKAAGPMGDFTLDPAAPGPYLFLSAGSGITPVMSMARTLHDLASPADMLFIHSAHTPADLPFTHERAAMAQRANFRSIDIVSRDTPGARWNGYRGRLTPAMLSLLAPDLHTRTIFCCGPAPYMAAIRAMLDTAGFDLRRFHHESFDFTADAEPEPTPPVTSADAFTIRFARTNQTIPCAPQTTVLAAARAAGLRLPSACGKGVCGTCKTRLLAGTVAMKHGGGIRPREIDEGLALLCCARPTSDLVVDR